MNIVLMVMAVLAAGGVAKALYQMEHLKKEHKRNKDALREFEEKYPPK